MYLVVNVECHRIDEDVASDDDTEALSHHDVRW